MRINMNKINKLVFGLSSLLMCTSALAGWEINFIDKFDGTGVDWKNWTAQTDANFNNEVQCYTDDDISVNKNFDVSDGTLKIIARKQQVNCAGLNNQSKSWTSGRINSKDKREFLYGRIESRIRFHNLEGGTWPAFWMLENRIAESPRKNDNDTIHWPNPGAGEIDVWEWFANSPSTYITNFFNTGGASCGNEVRYSYPNGASDVLAWHDYAIEWDENNISFYMDDTLVTSHNISACPQYKEPMFVLLNVAMGGNLGGNIDAALNKATMEVDYLAHCTVTNHNNATRCNESTPNLFSDDDNDGIANEVDQCTNTLAGEVVDTNGCPIEEETDECPNDPTVDCLPAIGDEDNDGITDDIDQCENTTEGSTVDLVGCLIEEENIAPRLTLSIKQNDITVSVIDINNGRVVITAEAIDSNVDDKLSFSWIIPGAIPAPIIKNLTHNETNIETVNFDPSSMLAARVYNIDVTVTDNGVSSHSVNDTVQLNITDSQTNIAAKKIDDESVSSGGGAFNYLTLLFVTVF